MASQTYKTTINNSNHGEYVTLINTIDTPADHGVTDLQDHDKQL